MLLAKPNPQNYYSVTVALYRPNLLIELKRFLFISFFSLFLSPFIAFLLFSFLFSLSFYFLVLFLSFFCAVAHPLSRHVRTKAGFVLLFELNEKAFLSTSAFLLFLCWCNVVSLCTHSSRRICVVLLIYNNVGCRKVCVDCCFRLLTCAKIEQRF